MSSLVAACNGDTDKVDKLVLALRPGYGYSVVANTIYISRMDKHGHIAGPLTIVNIMDKRKKTKRGRR
jgi:hypothetical protein